MYDDFLAELTELCKKHKVKIVSSESGTPTGLELIGIRGKNMGFAWESAFKKDGEDKYVETYLW